MILQTSSIKIIGFQIRDGIMYQNSFSNSLSALSLLSNAKSRSINAENIRGEKGKGGMASSALGESRKGSPCISGLEPGSITTLAEIEGPGVINHIWITVTDKTSEQNCFVLRDLVLRIFWDDEETPSVESPLGDFFCCGFAKGCLVNSLPIVVNPTRGFNSFFSMPFHKKAKISIENQHDVTVPAFFIKSTSAFSMSFPKTLRIFTRGGGVRHLLNWQKIML